MEDKKRKVVLGLGNILNRDEGVGVLALDRVRERLAGRGGVEVLDGGVLGLALLPIVESCSHLLLLDAVSVGKPPGTVVELADEEIPFFSRLKLSWHQLSFQEVLELAKARGRLPGRLRLLGVEPADISVGYGLSPAVEAAADGLAERVVAVLEDWGLA